VWRTLRRQQLTGRPLQFGEVGAQSDDFLFATFMARVLGRSRYRLRRWY